MDSFLQALSELPTLLTRVQTQLEANTKALDAAYEQLGNTRMYEDDAAKYLGVLPATLYHYRLKGLPYEKVGRIVSYRRKDLDEWRTAGRVRKHLTS